MRDESRRGLYYLVVFFVFSFIGGVLEILYSIIFRHRLVLGGFMYGMLRPIYGFGSLILVMIPERFRSNFWRIVITSFLVGSIYEYISSYILEVLFHKRWWDYSNFFLNIDGRVCLIMSIFWVVLGVLFYYVLEVNMRKIYKRMNKNILMGIIIILGVYFIIDSFLSIIRYFNYL